MVWGTSRARRHSISPDPDLEPAGAPPAIARCARCETPVIMAGGKLPRGWVEKDGEAYCPDDNPDRAAPAPRQRAIGGQRHHVDIGTTGARFTGARFTGCRIGTEIFHGMAAIELRAGASPPPGRDDRVQFLLDGSSLDTLVRELCDIRKELPHG